MSNVYNPILAHFKSEFKDEKMFEKLIKAGKTKSKCFKNDIVEQQV